MYSAYRLYSRCHIIYVEFVYEYLHQVDRALLLGVGRRLSAKLERIADGQLVCISKFVIDILHSEDYDDLVISATIYSS